MEIQTTKTVDVPLALNDPTQNLLRPAQMVEHEQEIRSAERQLEDPRVQDKGEVRKRLMALRKQYAAQAPKAVDGCTKDALVKESNELLNQITTGMLSQEEMRKNPTGSVHKHMKWEQANKQKIMRWKKLQLMIQADGSDPHSWDRDAANLERYRPQGAQDRFRADAQISGNMTYASVPAENWEEAFGTTEPENSALNQAKRVAQEQKATSGKK